MVINNLENGRRSYCWLYWWVVLFVFDSFLFIPVSAFCQDLSPNCWPTLNYYCGALVISLSVEILCFHLHQSSYHSPGNRCRTVLDVDSCDAVTMRLLRYARSSDFVQDHAVMMSLKDCSAMVVTVSELLDYGPDDGGCGGGYVGSVLAALFVQRYHVAAYTLIHRVLV